MKRFSFWIVGWRLKGERWIIGWLEIDHCLLLIGHWFDKNFTNDQHTLCLSFWAVTLNVVERGAKNLWICTWFLFLNLWKRFFSRCAPSEWQNCTWIWFLNLQLLISNSHTPQSPNRNPPCPHVGFDLNSLTTESWKCWCREEFALQSRSPYCPFQFLGLW